MADVRAKLSQVGNSQVGNSSQTIIFPYTPIITYSHQVEYSQYDLVHTNYAIQSFVKSRPGNIQVAAPFHNQTNSEVAYTRKVIAFLKSNTKMSFGNSENNGVPPPVLQFSAYGSIHFDKIPVFLGSFSITYPDDVDYVMRSSERFPVSMTINIDLIPHYSAKKQQEFNLNSFIAGDLYKDGYL